MDINLHSLPAESMLSHSHEWLTKSDIRSPIAAHPLGARTMSELQNAHDLLEDTVETQIHVGAMVASLSRNITAEDFHYDRFVRALHGFLSALADCADEPDEADQYLAARELLFPVGLSITQRSYDEEHGAIVEVEKRITPDVRNLLLDTVVGRVTLADLYDRWINSGKRLGAQIRERARLEAELANTNGELPFMHISDARNNWVRAVRVFLSALDLLPLESEVRSSILVPLIRDVDNNVRSHAHRRATEDGMGPVDDDLSTGDSSAHA